MSFENPDALVRNMTTYFIRRNEMGRLANSNDPIVNGDFNLWQRGTSFAAIANGAYSADRFLYTKNGVMVHTVSQGTNVPTLAESGHQSNYSIKIDCTTIDAAIGAGNITILTQRIEGYNFQPLAGKTFYLSFWVRATKTGIYCVSFRNTGVDRSYVVEYTVNSSLTWERKVIAIPFDFSGGTWDYTNGIGLQVDWALAVGANFQTTPDTWQNGSFMGTANQVNACDSTANNFFLSQIQLRPDSPPIFIVDRLFDEELAAAQWYYWKTYSQAIAPGTVNTATKEFQTRTAIAGGAAGSLRQSWDFPTMRAAPTIVFYSTDGTSGAVRNATAGNNRTGITADFIGDNSFRRIAVDNTSANAIALDDRIAFHFTAEAEL